MQSIQHKLQEFDPGIVWLDVRHRIVAVNDVAEQVFSAYQDQLIGLDVLSLHTGQRLEKVRFLLEQAAGEGKASPPPISMMINMPDRLLLIKVSRMSGKDGIMGHCMVFYDLTEVAMSPAEPKNSMASNSAASPRRLFKLPVYKNKQIRLIDLDDVGAIRAEGHYSVLICSDEEYLCNMALNNIEERVPSEDFMRVHRSYMVNLRAIHAVEKAEDQFVVIPEQNLALRIPVSRNKVAVLKQRLGL